MIAPSCPVLGFFRRVKARIETYVLMLTLAWAAFKVYLWGLLRRTALRVFLPLLLVYAICAHLLAVPYALLERGWTKDDVFEFLYQVLLPSTWADIIKAWLVGELP